MQILSLLLKKIDRCKNSSEKKSAIKVGEHFSWGYSVSTIWLFVGTESNHDAYRMENCMKNFCESLEEYAIKTSNFEKKKTIPLTKRQRNRIKR